MEDPPARHLLNMDPPEHAPLPQARQRPLHAARHPVEAGKVEPITREMSTNAATAASATATSSATSRRRIPHRRARRDARRAARGLGAAVPLDQRDHRRHRTPSIQHGGERAIDTAERARMELFAYFRSWPTSAAPAARRHRQRARQRRGRRRGAAAVRAAVLLLPAGRRRQRDDPQRDDRRAAGTDREPGRVAKLRRDPSLGRRGGRGDRALDDAR